MGLGEGLFSGGLAGRCCEVGQASSRPNSRLPLGALWGRCSFLNVRSAGTRTKTEDVLEVFEEKKKQNSVWLLKRVKQD